MGKEYLSRKQLENLEYGDVLKYHVGLGDVYLLVEKVNEGQVRGQLATPIHSEINSISIDTLVKMNPRLGKFD